MKVEKPGRTVGGGRGVVVAVGIVPLEQADTNRIATKAKIGAVTLCFIKTLP